MAKKKSGDSSPKKDPVYKCPVCHGEYGSLLALQQHLKVHEN